MSNNSQVTDGGIGVFGLLGVVFVTLKLCGVITWSWWFVTMPFWFGIGLFIALVLAVLSIE